VPVEIGRLPHKALVTVIDEAADYVGEVLDH
jgi:hypothetical protein